MSGGGAPQNHSHFKFEIADGYYFVGRLSEGDPGETLADIYAIRAGEYTRALVVDNNGMANGVSAVSEEQKTNLISAIRNSWGIEISDTDLAIGVVNQGETIPEWDTYELIS